MTLSDAGIRAAKPKDRIYKLADGGGLYLEISPQGSKLWRMKYRFEGKEKRLAFGVYPDVPLAGRKHAETGLWIDGARDKREAARQLLASGVDPGEQKKIVKAARDGVTANSFEIVAREWLTKFAPKWTPYSSARKLTLFEKDVFPWIGKKPISEVTAPDILKVLRRIEDRGAKETAARARMYCSQALRYAVATGRADRDPTGDLRGALSPVTKQHRAAITDPKAIGPLLRAIDSYHGYFVTKCALQLAPLVFVRPGELRNAEWKEIDLEKAEWTIPAARMKMRQPHLVPLSKQAVAILSSGMQSCLTLVRMPSPQAFLRSGFLGILKTRSPMWSR